MIVFWHWLALGALLAAIEVVTPGFFLLWLGLAAIAVGLVLLLAPDIALTVQVVIFGALSICSVMLGRHVMRRALAREDAAASMLNERGRAYVGKVYVLDQPLAQGRGRMHVGDTTWAVSLADSTADLPAGTRVRVVDSEGPLLRIKVDAA
ncbi:MAG: NfeD family protein [Alphaproteobacteria bacterium]|nr:NfeD family protein [Alphaproteobacteria bacterium]